MKNEDGEIQDYNPKEDIAEDKAEESKATVIEAENTLDMIQKALGGNIAADSKADAKPKKKPFVAKKAPTKKEKIDSVQRFFNNYSENPHLQQIENGYLKYLEAQHAKDSHLKAIKKFQIIYALKKIQRFWKIKYQDIRNRAAKIIQ